MLPTIIAALIALPALLWLAALVATLIGRRRVPLLARLPLDAERSEWPQLSLIVPACDEETSIEPALRAALASDYPALQLVAVDDRSTDRTGAIVDALAAKDPRVVAVHVQELPEGWLGKLNAMQRGLERADGEWLLFADADVHLAPGTLRRAIGYAERERVDFLSVIPHTLSAGFFGDSVFNIALALFCLHTRPWTIKRANTKTYGATGAFLLVRRTALERSPGLAWLKLEVADDFGMSLLIKAHGGKSDLLNGKDAVTLRWYASFGEMLRKMQKNTFAITGRFSLARIVVQVIVLAWLGCFPLLALVAPSTPIVALAGGGLLLQMLATGVAARWTGRPLASALLPALGPLLMGAIPLRAGIIGVRDGGIHWRGVLYRSEDLRKAQRVRF